MCIALVWVVENDLPYVIDGEVECKLTPLHFVCVVVVRAQGMIPRLLIGMRCKYWC